MSRLVNRKQKAAELTYILPRVMLFAVQMKHSHRRSAYDRPIPTFKAPTPRRPGIFSPCRAAGPTGCGGAPTLEEA